MKKSTLTAAIAVAIPVFAPTIFADPPAPPPGQSWNLVFSDDFETFNTDEWGSGSTPWGSENQSSCNLIPAEDTWVSDGNLMLRSREGSFTGPSGRTYPYSSGWAWMKNWRTYGYIEIRAQFPDHRGAWPAFWMLGDGWPPEFDVAEYRGQPRGYMTRAFYNGEWHTQTLGGDYSGWNTYGIEWAPNRLRWYVNGNLRFEYNGPTPSQPMYVILSNGTECNDGDGSGLPSFFNIDRVRWWQLNEYTQGPVPDGTYRITPTHAGNQAVEISEFDTSDGANIATWDYWGGEFQHWNLERNSDGYYYIKSVGSPGTTMDVAGESTANNANVNAWPLKESANQQFELVPNGSAYEVKPRHSGKCLDVGGSGNGSNVQQYSCWGGDNQMFKFIDVEE